MKSTVRREYEISCIRLIATALIITCHIMQYLDMELAWWFNVGVQIFLCMSGYLYGRKGKIEDGLDFCKKNARKILVNFYVVTICAIVLIIALLPEQRSTVLFARALLLSGRLPGGEHLWYIPYCLLCYFITPFLSHLFASSRDRKPIKTFVAICVIVFFVLEGIVNFFISAWIICYIIGYYLGFLLMESRSGCYKRFAGFIIVAAVVCNATQIIVDYVLNLKFAGIPAWCYEQFCRYSHVAFGVALFVVLRALFRKLFKKDCPAIVKKLCAWSDTYSYDIYLVHQFVILGPFSMMALTNMVGINIVLLLAATLAGAGAVNLISSYVRGKIKP